MNLYFTINKWVDCTISLKGDKKDSYNILLILFINYENFTIASQ